MIYHGHVQNGQIVLDEQVSLPEGAEVHVELSVPASQPATNHQDNASANAALMKYAGVIHDLPPDASRNLDHYLYGHPKS